MGNGGLPRGISARAHDGEVGDVFSRGLWVWLFGLWLLLCEKMEIRVRRRVKTCVQ